MMVCKRCESAERQKAGFVRGQQRYRCKGCGYFYTLTPPRGRPLQEKLLALSLYASGLSINRIAQYFRVSPPGVLRWIKKLGHTLCPKVEASAGVIVMELDEMWHYLKKNPTNCGSGKLMILLETNSWTGNVGVVVKTP